MQSIELTEFAPGEVEGITGLTTGAQRDWRHRGLLPSASTTGHARFDVLEIAAIYAMKALADRGIGPQKSAEISDLLGEAISWSALGYARAYDGEVPDADSESVDSRTDVDEILAKVRAKFPHTANIVPETEAINDLRKRLFSGLGKRVRYLPSVIPAPLLIWWAVGKPVFHTSYDEARQSLRADDPQTSRPRDRV